MSPAKRKRSPSPPTSHIEKAVKSLLHWRQSFGSQLYPSHRQEDPFLFLLFHLNTIPNPHFMNDTYQIHLPHSLLPKPPKLCLIINDTADNDEELITKHEAKEKIESLSIPISDILKFSKIKVHSRSSPLRRDLCDCFDMFFADKSMVTLLGGMFKDKDPPVWLDLKNNGDWKGQIERACCSGLLCLTTDTDNTCYEVRVGRVSMNVDDIVENVVAACKGFAHVVPNGWGNIGSIHLKLLESHSIQI